MATRTPARGRRKRRWRARRRPRTRREQAFRRSRRRRVRPRQIYWWRHSRIEVGALEKGLLNAYPNFTKWRVGKALLYGGEVRLDTLGRLRRVVIILPDSPGRTRPIVMADGPRRSRHRFYWSRPSSLCLWYSRDHKSLRWTPKEGIVGLIDLARLHLIKESWWRETNQWPGLEYHQEPPSGDERRPSRRSTSSESLRLRRQQCWCGDGRYDSCHGAIPERDELKLLGFE